MGLQAEVPFCVLTVNFFFDCLYLFSQYTTIHAQERERSIGLREHQGLQNYIKNLQKTAQGNGGGRPKTAQQGLSMFSGHKLLMDCGSKPEQGGIEWSIIKEYMAG